MAEGGDLVDNVSQKQSNELIVLAEGDDRIEQENELFALEAIFENEDLEICKHNNPNGHPPGGVFNIPVYTPENFCVKITKDLRAIRKLFFSAARGRGKNHRARLLLQDASKNDENRPGAVPTPQEKLYSIKRLPPITLNFSYPHNYPSVSPPNFTLSCCWLEKRNLTRLCEKLDDIWNKHKGSSVIAEWHDFLYHNVIDYLGIKSPYELGRVLIHIYTHPAKTKYGKSDIFTPKPFDQRGVQTFGSIEDVLPAVLDFNLTTCDVCMEEKPGSEFLRLTNCDEHHQCKNCSKGWIEALIKDGAVTDLHCPGYKCDKTILPHEVASVVSKELYQRYDKLLLKTAFAVMTDVMNCPRPFCQFPVVLEENLGLCQKCRHAFCGRCQNTYHGQTPCKLKSEMFAMLYEQYETGSEDRRLELEKCYGKQVVQRAIEETRSNRWLESNSKQCPCCSTFIQKKDGCNKMTCTNCRAFFCWLCQQELSKSNPYAHYQHPTSECADRLFEGVDPNEDFMDFFEDEAPESSEEGEDEEDFDIALI
ncbi:E3 ubiquitin-protein ligase RNF14-like isoform X2 [Biomphalaria glabrata]|uniref:RBR-type E3 ubiquitin transferase n=1 Tax=Biomphalaria glabrata TaxID=6526 RepID=A0A2C9JV20_BIOGL|nr:E3 ubiquitin-protein ligase RNF14-like [Biomphalaria glabrata]XP_055894605.1 E3 ubiquitin-protein ligase RNF14-like [Biomphalaria glabrata]XP_055894606.1 E3 ubiquitin-protein ligase RNF14-like [Biomphalaria glabrata]XP_055894607.1 E3 ubiquitin-protein ligase RNF14-like [Biomphalaria glabrata]XP_055894608.1 E3 ubiquitin-protein ligase RNF14-like [Biomphalaria glabrata]KAI8757173.1 E3 ubiquitin-protein ligase RNF14-like isoform X2 [Biomphalaria glabrata]